MKNQLVIFKDTFLSNIFFKDDIQRNTYILDYAETSTMFLRNLKVFAYREQAVKHPIFGNNLQTYIKNSLSGIDNFSPCFDIQSGAFIKKGTRHAKRLMQNLSGYIGVIYHIY